LALEYHGAREGATMTRELRTLTHLCRLVEDELARLAPGRLKDLARRHLMAAAGLLVEGRLREAAVSLTAAVDSLG
jgi:hypothetical protein